MFELPDLDGKYTSAPPSGLLLPPTSHRLNEAFCLNGGSTEVVDNDSAYDAPPGPGDAPSPNTGECKTRAQDGMPVMLTSTGCIVGADDAPGPQFNTPIESLARHTLISELSFELSGSSEPIVHSGSQANAAASGSELRQEQAREGSAEWSEAQWQIELETREVLR